jgi:hypothetical protein
MSSRQRINPLKAISTIGYGLSVQGSRALTGRKKLPKNTSLSFDRICQTPPLECRKNEQERGAVAAGVESRPSVALGTDCRITSDKLTGFALALDGKVLHLAMFGRNSRGNLPGNGSSCPSNSILHLREWEWIQQFGVPTRLPPK